MRGAGIGLGVEYIMARNIREARDEISKLKKEVEELKQLIKESLNGKSKD